jgi:hypothetical protein
MKHIRKFEELDYSTYISAADKLEDFGQIDRSKELRTHAVNMSRKEVDEMTFGILVGGVRPFPEAKFQEMSLFRSGESFLLRAIFNSGNNTHRIDSVINPKTGDITWSEGNKFLEKRSAMKFQKLVGAISKNQDDFQSFFVESKLTLTDLKVVFRTFYV